MDSNTLRQNISYLFLSLYSIYGVFMLGMTGLLFSFAIGLIVLSFNQRIEIVVATTILTGVLWKLMTDRRRKEGFQVPVGTGQDAKDIVKKVESITNKKAFEPSGVLSSSFTEGFEDAGSSEEKEKKESATPASSTAAPVNEPTVSEQMKKDADATNPAAVKKEETPSTAGFQDKGMAGMFQLGSIPADVVGGAHIDIGTTLTNALNSLKPDQVKAMTEDTRKLLETQKSLMGMLGSMKPMLQDGKQLMETFNQMFGGQGA
jgi:hypothetical protein